VSQIMFVNGSLVMEAIFGKDVSVGTFVFLLRIMVPILLYSACLLMQESSGELILSQWLPCFQCTVVGKTK